MSEKEDTEMKDGIAGFFLMIVLLGMTALIGWSVSHERAKINARIGALEEQVKLLTTTKEP